MDSAPYLVTFGLFLAGLLCVIVEVFVIPGFGFVGILGALILLGDAIYAWLTIGPLAGVIVGFLALVSSGAGLYIMMFTRVGRRFRLAGDLKDSHSSVSVGRANLVGREGVADTHLRPAGVALVDGERVDVTTEGEYVERNTRVRVTAAQGPRIVVEAIEDEPA